MTLSRDFLKNFLCLALLLYSGAHFLSSSGLSPNSAIGGDFISGFPSFWAWKFNPKMIQENPSVQGWMGGQYLELNEELCSGKNIPKGENVAIDTIVQPPKVCREYMRQKQLSPDQPLLPIQVVNRTWQYGPMMHFVTFPLMFLKSFSTALRAWYFVCLIAYLCLFYLWYDLLFRSRGLSSFSAFCLFSGLWFNFSPSYDALRGAEIEILEFLFLTLSLWYAAKKKSIKAGAALALSVFMKYTPLVFVPYFLWRRQYKIVASACLFMAGLWVVTQATLGWEWSYSFRMLQKIGAGTTATGSQAFSSLIYRLFTNFDLFNDSTSQLARLPVTNTATAQLITKIFALSLIAFYGILFLLRRGKEVMDVELSLISLLMVTLIQWNHIYYLIFLLMGYSVALSSIFKRVKTTGIIPKLESGVLFASLVLVGYFLPGSLYHRVFAPLKLNFWDAYSVLSLPVYGYSILLVWLTVKIVKQSGEPLWVRENHF